MGFYQYRKEILLNATIDEVWDFIADPHNLKVITPPYMGFNITSEELPEKMYAGMIISYKVKPLLGIPVTWVTEITHVTDKKFFIDQQRIGPYSFWHHQHIIQPLDGKVLMKDIVSYKPPLGYIGTLANKIIINKKIREIFDYREERFLERFPQEKDPQITLNEY